MKADWEINLIETLRSEPIEKLEEDYNKVKSVNTPAMKRMATILFETLANRRGGKWHVALEIQGAKAIYRIQRTPPTGEGWVNVGDDIDLVLKHIIDNAKIRQQTNPNENYSIEIPRAFV